MKKVVDESTVAHMWANQTQDEARKQNRSFFFEKETIYSYGYHFPIAVLHQRRGKEKVVLFTTRTYSNTTAGHIRTVEAASSQYTKIYCKDVQAAQRGIHTHNIEEFNREARNIADNLIGSKKPEIYYAKISAQRTMAERYAEYFNIKLSKRKLKYLFLEPTENEQKGIEKRREAAEKKATEQARLEAANIADKIVAFRNGDIDTIYAGTFTYLRYNAISKRIETSQQVHIPVDIAKQFYYWLKESAENGGCSAGCERKLMQYNVRYVSATEFRVGCHLIPMSEATEIAKALNW